MPLRNLKKKERIFRREKVVNEKGIADYSQVQWSASRYKAKLHILTLYITIFKVGKLRLLDRVSISNFQKLIEWIYREVEGYSGPEKHYEPIQRNYDFYNFHTTVGYKFYSSTHRL